MDLDSAAPIQDKPAAKPDIGVFLCKCGKNIGGSVDIDSLAEAIKDTPSVKHVQVNTYTCSEPGQAEIETAIAEHRLEKIVVAACSPRLHGPTWQELLRRSDLNPAVVEVANIREQCSWVHLHEKAAGTRKALELVRMAVARAELLQPVPELKVPVTQRALVIGGGVAGIQAALDLADDGYETILVEKSPTIGGIMALIDKTFPTMDCSICILGPKMADAGKHRNIKLIANAEVSGISGYVGNFEVNIRRKARYVDETLCTACNDCVEVCPVDVVDEQALRRQQLLQPVARGLDLEPRGLRLDVLEVDQDVAAILGPRFPGPSDVGALTDDLGIEAPIPNNASDIPDHMSRLVEAVAVAVHRGSPGPTPASSVYSPQASSLSTSK